MKLLSSIRRPLTHETLELLVNKQEFVVANPLLEILAAMGSFELRQMLNNLEKRGLIYLEQNHSAWCLSSHLIIREYFSTSFL
ncbi:MAG: hypothetical protein IPM76_07980 [Chloroflexi bacterium]|nr:hypothetical protein [Chloroflexota bacterium]